MAKEINEIKAIEIVDNTLNQLNDNDARDRVIRWAFQKYASKSNLPEIESESKGAAKRKSKKVKKKAKGKTKSGKASFSVIKELNLVPKGKKTFRDFCSEKKPKSIKEKCVVCVYYLINILKSKQIGINHVYTCFKNIKEWRNPADLKNMLHQSASDGWLDTSKQNDIKITKQGENLIEHDLPNKKE